MAGEEQCWAFLRGARTGFLTAKRPLVETLQALDRAAAAAAGAPAGSGGCAGWVERTRGDSFFREKRFAQAAEAYERAIGEGFGGGTRALLGRARAGDFLEEREASHSRRQPWRCWGSALSRGCS
jgi:predicted lipid-binding transport protein (Tim44 family)